MSDTICLGRLIRKLLHYIRYCHKFFGRDLPSVTLRKRSYVKFIDTNGHSRYFHSF